MVKQPTAEQSEFQMSNEDFPALPGTQIGDNSSSQQSNMSHSLSNNATMGGSGNSGLDLVNSGIVDSKGIHHHGNGAAGVGMVLSTESISAQDKAFKRGVQTSPDGKLNLFN